MKTLKELTRQVINFRDARDWKKFHTPKDLSLSLMIEAAEVGEIFKWKTPEDINGSSDEIRTRVGKELSDVLYASLLLAHEFGIDLAAAFDAKMVENELKYPVEKFKGSNKKYNDH